MPQKRLYIANLSNGETMEIEAISGPKAMVIAQATAPDDVEVKSVVTEVPVGTGKDWGRTADHVTDLLDGFPTVCGECGANVKHSATKTVSRKIPYPAGTVIYFGMPTTEEMRVCQTHEVVTNWPKRESK